MMNDTSDLICDGVHSQYPVSMLLRNIGLDAASFCGRFLDVGCGRDARLVRYLRARGIQAYGIDPTVEGTEPYLIKQCASDISQPDRYYDLVVSHYAHFKDGMESNKRVVIAIGGERCFSENYSSSMKPPMMKTVREAVRLLKPGCRFVIWPEPRYLLEESRQEILDLGAEISVEEVTPIIFEELKGNIPFDEFCNRAVLTKR